MYVVNSNSNVKYIIRSIDHRRKVKKRKKTKKSDSTGESNPRPALSVTSQTDFCLFPISWTCFLINLSFENSTRLDFSEISHLPFIDRDHSQGNRLGNAKDTCISNCPPLGAKNALSTIWPHSSCVKSMLNKSTKGWTTRGKKACRPFFASKMPREELRDKNTSTKALSSTKLNVAFASALTARLTANSIFKVSFFYPSRPAK